MKVDSDLEMVSSHVAANRLNSGVVLGAERFKVGRQAFSFRPSPVYSIVDSFKLHTSVMY